MSYLIFQICFFFILLIWVFKTHKSGVVKFVIIEWTFCSCISYAYAYFYLLGQVSFNYLPVVYWDLCYLIYLFPVLGVNIAEVKVSEKFVSYSLVILTIIGILAIIPFFENLSYVVKNYSSQHDTVMEMYQNKMDVYNKKQLISWMSPLGLFLHNIIFKFTYAVLLLFFIVSTKKPNIPKTTLVLLFCFFANSLCFILCQSGRGGIVEFLFTSTIFWLLFRKIIILRISKSFLIAAFTGVIGIFSAIVILTLIRTGDSESNDFTTTWLSLSLYLGEGQVNFFQDMWDCKVSAQGDYCFSYIKNILGLDTFTNYLERREYWNYQRVGYDPVRFYTFIGSFFADLKYFTIVFMSIISFLFSKMIQKKHGILNPLLIYSVYIYLVIIIMGFSIFNYMTYNKFRELVICFLSFFVLYLVTKEKKYET